RPSRGCRGRSHSSVFLALGARAGLACLLVVCAGLAVAGSALAALVLAALAVTAVEDLGQHRSLADVVALGRGEQGQRALLRIAAELVECLGGVIVLELLAIAARELVELLGIV